MKTSPTIPLSVIALINITSLTELSPECVVQTPLPERNTFRIIPGSRITILTPGTGDERLGGEASPDAVGIGVLDLAGRGAISLSSEDIPVLALEAGLLVVKDQGFYAAFGEGGGDALLSCWLAAVESEASFAVDAPAGISLGG